MDEFLLNSEDGRLWTREELIKFLKWSGLYSRYCIYRQFTSR